jgi:pilus assembly protein CpaF
MLELLEGIVKARLNILISGGTGAGKTTLLNILSSFIPEDERIVTIEDSAELQLRQPHVVRLETRPRTWRGGRGAAAAAADQRAAHAAGPHRGRRGARRRGGRHAAGDEHRPRRLDHHAARQHPARRARPPRDDDLHGEPEPAREGDAPADLASAIDVVIQAAASPTASAR